MKQEFAANDDGNELSLVPDPFLVVSCPFLGVHNDPGTPMGYPTPDNRCFAFEPALNLDLEKQRAHCLTDCYDDCLHFKEQMADAPEENSSGSRVPSFLRRFVHGRTLAAGIMLILILLAVLIWWPPPGTSTEEGTVFGVSFTLNSPNVEEGVEAAEQQTVSQISDQESEADAASPAAAAGEPAPEAQQPAPVAEATEKSDGTKRSNALDKNSAQGATLNSPSADEVGVLLADPPAVQSSPPEPQEVVEEDPSTAPVETAVEQKPIVVERIKKNESNEEPGPEAADPNRANPEPIDQEQGEQPMQAESPAGSSKASRFTPIAYGEAGSDKETLKVYQDPQSGDYTRIARPELFDLLGRDETAGWIKIRAESGIEGWVLVSDTGLGSWIKSLPEITP